MGGQSMWLQDPLPQAQPAQVDITSVHICSDSFPLSGISETLSFSIFAVLLRFHRTHEVNRMNPPTVFA